VDRLVVTFVKGSLPPNWLSEMNRASHAVRQSQRYNYRIPGEVFL
jgi:hypothetical protein